ncbi:DUF1307 domain-containing protein [Actinomyces sp. zg-332]|uniref:DUF1307 domain-containing protein n=1 Tax=Actinomyces sp. zg-332 TaxID=2708340 RepID=UPI0014212165|nr:DUF1307 domain-containing protein [Actinomyces sp. zg-332]QPK94243.1 DUF1307 domain-containing protein [Actinomyces sp. zg-332]
MFRKLFTSLIILALGLLMTGCSSSDFLDNNKSAVSKESDKKNKPLAFKKFYNNSTKGRKTYYIYYDNDNNVVKYTYESSLDLQEIKAAHPEVDFEKLTQNLMALEEQIAGHEHTLSLSNDTLIEKQIVDYSSLDFEKAKK